LRVRIDPPAAASPAARLQLIDMARGLAVLAMVVYHFCWDLRYFGYIASDVEGGLGWRIFSHATAGSFLFIVGVSLVLATRRGFDLRRFLRRLGVIVAAAAAITLVTFFVFPETYIFFGILHNIAVASVLGLPFLRAPILLVVGAAIACFAAPPLLAGPAFDSPALVWLGLASAFPRTNDFVPLFPWFGVVLLGIAATRAWLIRAPEHLPISRARMPWQLLWVGRQSLAIYLLHQPILFGLVYLAAQVYPPDLLGFEDAYVGNCVASCVESEVEAEICRKTCACAAEGSQAAGLWSDLMRQTLSIDQQQRYFDLVDQCRGAAEP
jgi:uncharacterized membrane protein